MPAHNRMPSHKRFVVDLPSTRYRGISSWRYLVALTRDSMALCVRTTVGGHTGDRCWHYRTIYRAGQDKPISRVVHNAIEAARALQREEGVPL